MGAGALMRYKAYRWQSAPTKFNRRKKWKILF